MCNEGDAATVSTNVESLRGELSRALLLENGPPASKSAVYGAVGTSLPAGDLSKKT